MMSTQDEQYYRDSPESINNLKRLEGFFKLSSFKYNHGDKRLEKNGYWGGFVASSHKFIDVVDNNNWVDRIIRLIAHLCIYYALVKIGLTGVIHFRHDTLVKLGKNPTTLDHRGRCLAETNMFSPDLGIQYKLNNHRKWLDFLGDPLINTPGLSITIYYFITLTPFFFFLIDYFRKTTRSFSFAHLNFLMDPVSEQLRLKRKLSQIMRDCIGKPEGLVRAQYQSTSFNQTKRSGFYRLVYRQTMQTFEDRSEKLALERALQDIENFNLVEPANLTNEWRLKLIKLKYMFLHSMAFIWIGSLFLNISVCVMIQLYLQGRERASFIRCNHSQNSTSYYEANNRLLAIDEPHRVAYMRSDGSMWSEIRLGLSVEPVYYFTSRRLLFLIELYGICTFGCIWGTLAVDLSLFSVIHSLKWASQIEDQLDTCIDVMKRLLKTKNQEEDEQLNRSLVTCYLNYSLYRREYPSFKTTTSLLANKFIILVSCYFIIIYFSVIRSDLIFKQLISSFMIGVAMAFNLYLATFSFLITKSERIMKRISKLMAIGTASEKYKISIALWRRLLLDSSQLKDIFALKFFETRVDSKMIVTMNVYLIAILLLFR